MAKILSCIFKSVVSTIQFVCVIFMSILIGLFAVFSAIYHVYSCIIETVLLHVGIDARKRREQEEPGGGGYFDGFNLVGWVAIILMLIAIITGVSGMISQMTGH